VGEKMGSGLFVIRSTEKNKYWNSYHTPKWTDIPTASVTREMLFSEVMNLLANANTDQDQFRPFEVIELNM
jgi:hypothetical protein